MTYIIGLIAVLAICDTFLLRKKNNALNQGKAQLSADFHTFFDRVEERYGLDVAMDLSSMEE